MVTTLISTVAADQKMFAQNLKKLMITVIIKTFYEKTRD